MPNRLQCWKIRGAWPSRERPYNVRDAMKMQADAEDIADVITTALMIEGTAETPLRLKAMTNGELCAVPSGLAI